MTLLFSIIDWLSGNYIELVAAVLGIVGVWLTTRQLVWCWPVGMLNVILSLYVFFVAKLYADVALQFFYIVMTIYGWYQWQYGGKNRSKLKVSRINIRTLVLLLIISAVSISLTGFLFSRYTDASLPYWDATVAVWGVIGTWAQAKKLLENWLIWIITDLLCTGIYFYKELYAFTVLYLIFVVLATYGYYTWLTDYRKIKAAS